ncbi:hypothetical protein MOO44_05025 [Nicoliella spurrieriana]|uniref:Uncharacterized protein n=1 Tax=Nicoliella spurrieriana TaxID=2925830 RepID=A0A976RR59_9LACO|nr:hypothetical protein [Nicoliella spurrieriana]UQS86288.1 hypothetical protein MOO44_05025 [Nicoliella spurrieriana]
MSEYVPENMREVKHALIDLEDEGKHVDPDQFIGETVENLFQIYLDEAEEGHYDTARLVKPNLLQVFDLTNQVIHEEHSTAESFVADFKNDADKLLMHLGYVAYDVAAQ